MADPFTLLTVAAAGTSAVGSIMQGNAGYQQGMYESGVAAQNAKIAKQNATQIRLAGAQAEEAKRRQILKDLGRSAAAISETGTGGPSVGSNARLLKQAGTEAEFDAQNVRYGYESQAYGQDVQSLQQQMEAQAARRRARQARTSGYVGAISNLLSAGANYSGQAAQTKAMSTTASGSPVAYGSGSGRYGNIALPFP